MARFELTISEGAWVEVARETLAESDAPDLGTVGGAEFMVGRLQASLRSVLAIVEARTADGAVND